ncbi:MAG: hypothetical protein WAX69_09260, partial [Victivallales bacterium]
TICHPLRGLNIKRWFASFYNSLRRRCNPVAQRRKPWENTNYMDSKSPQGGDTLLSAGLKLGAFGSHLGFPKKGGNPIIHGRAVKEVV